MEAAIEVEEVDVRDRRARIVLAIIVLLYVVVFARLTWRQQTNYGTFGYDMGIHDQAIWLLSRFHSPFSTIRGLNYFGHHIDLISVLFVPFYWLGGGPHLLYFVETVALAAGAVPIWLIGRENKLDPYLALIPAGAFLLHPSIEWTNWWHFHPDALALTPLLFAWWFALRRNWLPYWIAIGLALATKEDAALAVAMMGAVLFIRRERQLGAWTFGIAVAWFLAATRVFIPLISGGAPFYDEMFPGLGKGLPEVLFNMVRHPSRVYRPMLEHDRLVYFRKMTFPFALLPLAAPLVLLVGAPQTLVVSLAGHSPARDIKFHYGVVILVGLAIATVEGFARIVRRGDGFKIAAVALLCVSAVVSNREWSPSPIARDYRSGIWAMSNARRAALDEAVHEVRGRDKVAATYLITPHLTHRRYIYEFPNPWRPVNWDPTYRADAPAMSSADTIVLDTNLLGDAADLYNGLVAADGTFRVVFEREGVVVARRWRAPNATERRLSAEARQRYESDQQAHR